MKTAEKLLVVWIGLLTVLAGGAVLVSERLFGDKRLGAVVLLWGFGLTWLVNLTANVFSYRYVDLYILRRRVSWDSMPVAYGMIVFLCALLGLSVVVLGFLALTAEGPAGGA